MKYDSTETIPGFDEVVVELKENGGNDNAKVIEIADDKNDNGEKNNKNVEIEEKNAKSGKSFDQIGERDENNRHVV